LPYAYFARYAPLSCASLDTDADESTADFIDFLSYLLIEIAAALPLLAMFLHDTPIFILRHRHPPVTPPLRLLFLLRALMPRHFHAFSSRRYDATTLFFLIRCC